MGNNKSYIKIEDLEDRKLFKISILVNAVIVEWPALKPCWFCGIRLLSSIWMGGMVRCVVWRVWKKPGLRVLVALKQKKIPTIVFSFCNGQYTTTKESQTVFPRGVL